MEQSLSMVFFVSLSLMLLHLLLTMILTRRVNAISAIIYRQPELPIGHLAPNFKAETLAGEIVSLATFTGHSVLFVFVHPHCQACLSKIPLLQSLAPVACQADNIHFVLVVEDKYTLAQSMVDRMGISLPILIAPREKSQLARDYNPESIYPYYCLIDEKGTVQSRAPLGRGDWPKMQRKWEEMSSQVAKALINQYR